MYGPQNEVEDSQNEVEDFETLQKEKYKANDSRMFFFFFFFWPDDKMLVVTTGVEHLLQEGTRTQCCIEKRAYGLGHFPWWIFIVAASSSGP